MCWIQQLQLRYALAPSATGCSSWYLFLRKEQALSLGLAHKQNVASSGHLHVHLFRTVCTTPLLTASGGWFLIAITTPPPLLHRGSVVLFSIRKLPSFSRHLESFREFRVALLFAEPEPEPDPLPPPLALAPPLLSVSLFRFCPRSVVALPAEVGRLLVPLRAALTWLLLCRERDVPCPREGGDVCSMRDAPMSCLII